MVTTRNRSYQLPKRALSDLTGATWQLLLQNPATLKVRATITLGTNQQRFSLNEQDDSKIKTKFTMCNLSWSQNYKLNLVLLCFVLSGLLHDTMIHLSIDRPLRIEIFESQELYPQFSQMMSWLGWLICLWLSWHNSGFGCNNTHPKSKPSTH
jgi:hypothetical protein